MSIYKTYNKTTLKTVTMLRSGALSIPQSSHVISNDITFPALYNGIEFSYSFWLFVCAEDLQNSESDKFIMARCPNSKSLRDASPVFYMDGQTNKMFVSLRIKDSGFGTLEEIKDDTTNYFTTMIDYVPLQRWVNVLLVVDNQFVQIFVDGELRNVEDLSAKSDLIINNVPKIPSGSLVVGKISSEIGLNKKSFISKVQASNYALTIDHAKILYKAGPLNASILQFLGLNNMGIRNPFYTISGTIIDKEDDTEA